MGSPKRVPHGIVHWSYRIRQGTKLFSYYDSTHAAVPNDGISWAYKVRVRSWQIALIFLFSSSVSSAAPRNPEATPSYPEEGRGESMVWLSIGPLNWLTERSPQTSQIPASGVLGFAHQIDTLRLAWRLMVAHDTDTGQTTFIALDLLNVERVYVHGRYRPYGRVGFGVGFDTSAPSSAFGDQGFFNDDNGTTGGFGLTGGLGIDIDVYRSLYTKLDFGLGVYGGVGRTSVPYHGRLGIGLRY